MIKNQIRKKLWKAGAWERGCSTFLKSNMRPLSGVQEKKRKSGTFGDDRRNQVVAERCKQTIDFVNSSLSLGEPNATGDTASVGNGVRKGNQLTRTKKVSEKAITRRTEKQS